jgi:hypothetical protein
MPEENRSIIWDSQGGEERKVATDCDLKIYQASNDENIAPLRTVKSVQITEKKI